MGAGADHRAGPDQPIEPLGAGDAEQITQQGPEMDQHQRGEHPRPDVEGVEARVAQRWQREPKANGDQPCQRGPKAEGAPRIERGAVPSLEAGDDQRGHRDTDVDDGQTLGRNLGQEKRVPGGLQHRMGADESEEGDEGCAYIAPLFSAGDVEKPHGLIVLQQHGREPTGT